MNEQFMTYNIFRKDQENIAYSDGIQPLKEFRKRGKEEVKEKYFFIRQNDTHAQIELWVKKKQKKVKFVKRHVVLTTQNRWRIPALTERM